MSAEIHPHAPRGRHPGAALVRVAGSEAFQILLLVLCATGFAVLCASIVLF